MTISSTSNPRIRRARALKRKTDRDAEGAFLVESMIGLEDAVSSGLIVREVFVVEGRDDLMERCSELDLGATIVPEHVLRAVSDTTTPQGVVAVVAMPRPRLRDIPAEADLVVVLAEVRDPGNAGTLVRTAVAAGADAVVFTEASVDPYAPKTVRASAGALFALPIVRGVPLGEAVQMLADRGLRVFLAEADEGRPLFDVDLTGPSAFVLGNEARGIPEGEGSDATPVSIPMPGGTESLNVAVAGSILLYETVRQRSHTRG
jgi:TrmH family RNA methyltransferase